jgi:hypothetical protein
MSASVLLKLYPTQSCWSVQNKYRQKVTNIAEKCSIGVKQQSD